MFWVRPDLDSEGKVNWGGGVFWNQIPEQGCSGEFGQKFLETQLGSLACLFITDSLSHVETNESLTCVPDRLCRIDSSSLSYF